MNYTTSHFTWVPSHRLYSEIDQIHLSSEAQCVSHHLPQVDCHTKSKTLCTLTTISDFSDIANWHNSKWVPIASNFAIFTISNIIQSECVSKSIFTVCGLSSMKFGMKLAHRTLITVKILRSSFLGNRFHGNQKTSSELINELKGD